MFPRKVIIVSERAERPCQTDSGGGHVVCRSRNFLTGCVLAFKPIWSPIMANRTPETLGDFVRRIRNKKGLSLTDVAEQSGRYGPPIASSYVSRIENDPTRKPTAVALRKLAHGLGIPPEDLLVRAAGLIDPGVNSEERYLLSKFRELSQERRDDVIKIVDLWHSEEIPRRTPRRKSA